MKYKLPLLNLFRHKVRSILSLLTIAGAVAAVVVFRGYSTFITEGLKTFGVESQYGHLQVASEKLWSPTTERYKDQLSELLPQVLAEIKNTDGFVSISPRISFQGLLTFNDSQFGITTVGFDPLQEPLMFNSVTLRGRGNFVNTEANEVLLGSGLMKRLKVKVGDSVSLIVQTVDGVMNAVDLSVRGSFETTLAEVDDQVAYVPLNVAKKVLDTNKVEKWIIRLEDIDKAPKLKEDLAKRISTIQAGLAVRSWRDLATLYKQVDEFYFVQNLIIQIILSTLTVLAVLNTVGMTVFERTGEIGTLRALGYRRRDVLFQFFMEGLYLSIIASIVGIILGAIAIEGVNVAKFTITLPGASVPIEIMANYSGTAFLLAVFSAVVSTLIGSIIPTIKVSRMPIVDALRKNI